ncbi:MAG TPA: YhdP family protein [Rhodanobacter sp.]|nr:YhdP family protein [Rhodanobacter sp.]
MNVLWQRRLHRSLRALGWAAGIMVIVLAVMMALGQLLLPLLARHPAWVAGQLSRQLHRPVNIGSMQGHWTAAGPEFVLHDVKIGAAKGEGAAALQLPESSLQLDVGGLLLPSRRLVNLHVRGLKLDLLHDLAGWHVQGVGGGASSDRQPISLHGLSLDLWLADLRLQVNDTTTGKRYILWSPQLRLSHGGDRFRVGGRLLREGVPDASVRVAGRFDDDGRTGRAWVTVDGAQLPALLDGVDMDGYALAHGNGRLSVWLDWRQGKLRDSLFDFELDALAVTTPTGDRASVVALHGLAGVRGTDDGYQLRWAGDDGSALVANLHDPGNPKSTVDVAARALQLAPLLPWLALKPDLSPSLVKWLGNGHPRGELGRVALHWAKADGLHALVVQFKGLGIDPAGKLPGLDDLHGELRGDAEAISLELPAQATTVTAPGLFRQPFVLSKLAGKLALWVEDGDWHIGVDTLDLVGAGYDGRVRGELSLPSAGGAPFADIYADVGPSDVVAAKLFWPVGVMSPGSIAWLDRALIGGKLDQAQVVLRGNLGDWPFRHNEGRFEARAQISDLTFDYGQDWPHATGVDAIASFVNNGMLIEANAGQSLGVKAGKAVALIPDFRDGLLDLNVQGSGSGASLLNFARRSPIASHQADTLAKLKLGGSGTFEFHLALPLKDASAAWLNGSAQLQDADLVATAWNLQLDKLSGPLTFDLHGMQAGPLETQFRGQPSTLQLAIAGANVDPATILAATLQGSYRVAELVQGYPSLDWIARLADGRSDYGIGFTIAHQPNSDALAQTISIDSPLIGTALDLPAPLDKPADASLPLHLTMSLPASGGDVQLGLGQLVRGHLHLSDGPQHPLAGTLAFGDEMPQNLPSRDLRIRGHAATLDVTGWVQRIAAGAGGDGPGLESLDASTDQAGWFGRSLGPLKLRATPQPGLLSVDVDGPAMAGNFSVPTQELDKRGVTARLQRLHWPGQEATPSGTRAANAAGSTVPVADPANTGINPAALPPFHLWVGDLRMGDAKLGEARLETWPTMKGMHIEQLRALSRRVQITASGDWNGTASDSHTHMRINFSAEDLGAMLGAFGFDGLVNGGKTHDQLDASWPGGPSALSLATMNGKLSVDVRDGRIPEASSPGVGRLLGLVSLAELPRRLTLDFGDVFGKGLGFDSITGDFHLADGNATTRNLVIDGPSANISFTGRTGLRAHDYDQQMHVIPHVGNSLPLVGAVVAGPIGAAAGFAVQGLLGKGLNKAASARYRITGSWNDPVITLLEKHLPAAPAATVPLGPGSAVPAGGGSAPSPAAASSVQP